VEEQEIVFQPGGADQTQVLPRQPDRRTGRIVALAAGGVMLVMLGVYTSLVFSLGDRVPRGTTVAGVEIGGLSRDAAEARLRQRLLPRAEKPIDVTAGGKSYTLKPSEAGLALNVAATADAAYVPRTFNPVRVVEVLVGGGEVRPVLTVDKKRLNATIAALAKKVDRPAREARITFAGGTPKPHEPRSGYKLDRDAAAQKLAKQFLLTSPIALPAAEILPAAGQDELDRAMREFAQPAMSSVVKVQVGDESFDVTPEEVGSALQMVPDAEGTLTPKLDPKKFAAAVADKLDEVQKEPQDAQIVISGGAPTILPSKAGHAVPRAKLAQAVVAALPKTGDERVAKVQTVVAQPELTTAEARKLGVREIVSEFTTHYPHAEYRNVNIGRAAELINGALIKPGEIFSLNGLVGERTKENGFTEGYIIRNGRLREDLGGGVSQVATTTYNAAFFAGMEDVEHRPHSFYIDRYPMGREATVFWGSLDLKWRNNTPYGVLVQAWINPSTPSTTGSVTVRLWSTKYWTVREETSKPYNVKPPKTIYDDEEGCVPQENGVEGFQVDVKRWIYRDGKLVDSEVDHVTYAPEDRVICGPEPKDPETPPPPE
jgi:vancomycin resistance protein YoaR